MLKKVFDRLFGVASRREQSTLTDVATGRGVAVADEYSSLAFGGACIQKLMAEYSQEFSTVLDIGSGEGKHSEIFRNHGKVVTEVDFGASEYFLKNSENRNILSGNYLNFSFDEQFDLIWACHVLEHQRNAGQFLTKIYEDLKVGGILAITVPPLKHEVVGGHMTLWNAGLLMYNLVLAGFDCHEARILQYGYNISLIAEKREIELPELAYDRGDIMKLIQYFPKGLTEPFDGNIKELNWGS